MASVAERGDALALSLNLGDLWELEGVEFDSACSAFHIYVSPKKTNEYVCPVCGRECRGYDREEDERVWRHVDVLTYRSYVHCRRPRVKCAECGVRVIHAPWARSNSRYTLAFEGAAVLLTKAMPRERARKLLGISNTSLTYLCGFSEDNDGGNAE